MTGPLGIWLAAPAHCKIVQKGPSGVPFPRPGVLWLLAGVFLAVVTIVLCNAIAAGRISRLGMRVQECMYSVQILFACRVYLFRYMKINKQCIERGVALRLEECK